MKIGDLARNKWRGILDASGIDKKFLTGKHGPCPFCEGTDRFRWDNSEGKGSFFCNACGAGDGFALLMRFKGWDFKTTAREVEKLLGHVREEKAHPKIDPNARAQMLNTLWTKATALDGEDMASRYLASRDVLPRALPNCLRFHANCPVPFGGGYLPALLALVRNADGEPVNIHRTFLGPNGKADIETPRAMMPGELADGSAVRLYAAHGERLGIAEGIETAIAAAKRFNLPVWASLNSTMLEKWIPPDGLAEVWIFGDNDTKFGGQASAYALAHRLATRHRMAVKVHIPDMAGKDWADTDTTIRIIST